MPKPLCPREANHSTCISHPNVQSGPENVQTRPFRHPRIRPNTNHRHRQKDAHPKGTLLSDRTPCRKGSSDSKEAQSERIPHPEMIPATNTLLIPQINLRKNKPEINKAVLYNQPMTWKNKQRLPSSAQHMQSLKTTSAVSSENL